MKESSINYEKTRTELQREIDVENRRLLHIKSQPSTRTDGYQRNLHTSNSDQPPTKLSPHRPPKPETNKPKKPHTLDIPKNTLISPDYDVDRYLRRNLNFNINHTDQRNNDNGNKIEANPTARDSVDIDTLPIPMLRYSSKSQREEKNNNLSDAMKRVDDKWRVPAVEKNILKNLPNEKGKSLSILTQLGSIRKQLQLEQLKLDNMVPKNNI